MTSQRVTDGYKTKGSTSQIVSPQEYSGSNALQNYDQGVYINDINVLMGSAVSKLRPNNDFFKVVRGQRIRITEGAFNDTESPSSLVISGTSGSIDIYEKSQIPMILFQEVPGGQTSGEKYSGVTVAPSHDLMDYDFGQPDFFQDGTAYEEKSLALISGSALDPQWIIETLPSVLPLLISQEMVNSSEMISSDSVIDPFSVRKEADRSFTEIPFRFKGIRGDLVNDNAYRRSSLIVDEQLTVVARMRDGTGGSPNSFSTDPFLDAGNEFGLDELTESPDIGSINSEGFLMPETSVVSPFRESNDSELTALLLENQGDVEMRSIIIALTFSGSNSFPTHDYLSRDNISLRHGFVYDNNYTGVESLAFGGLLK